MLKAIISSIRDIRESRVTNSPIVIPLGTELLATNESMYLPVNGGDILYIIIIRKKYMPAVNECFLHKTNPTINNAKKIKLSRMPKTDNN